jgi:hypothetical protein
MTEEEKIDWIKTASYEDLLRRWRFEPIGTAEWFLGPVGKVFRTRMQQCREKLSIEEAMEISKRVGWDHGVNNRDFKL